jgi:tripartite-type tricarboxylate transporter receptor subunit TctC
VRIAIERTRVVFAEEYAAARGDAEVVGRISGETSITFGSIIETVPQIAAGKMRPLGVTALKRSPALPAVPTIAEAGLPGYEFAAWHVLFAPRGTPAPVVASLSESVKRVLQAPGAARHYEDRGLDVIGTSPQEAAVHLKNEMNKWGKVIRERGMRAD